MSAVLDCKRKIYTIRDLPTLPVIAQKVMKLADDDPDYPAAVLAHYILGGSSSSRLNTRIRNQEGLSYAVQANLAAPTRDDGGRPRCAGRSRGGRRHGRNFSNRPGSPGPIRGIA